MKNLVKIIKNEKQEKSSEVQYGAILEQSASTLIQGYSGKYYEQHGLHRSSWQEF